MSAHAQAIFDEPKQHATLVRYYRRLGCKPLRDVGDDFRAVADRMVWGGVGTLMEVEVEDFLRKWGDTVRAMKLADNNVVAPVSNAP